VINSGMLAGISITLTGHSMTVIQVDGGGNVVPHTAGSVGVLFPGQRMDVILRWDSSASSSTIQIALDTEAFRYVNSALVTSQEFPLFLEPPARHSTIQKQHRFDLATATSRPLLQALPEIAHQTIVLYTKTLKLAHLSNIPHGFINQTSWKPQSPPLMQLSRTSYDANQFVSLVHAATPGDSSPRWLDVVLNNLDEDDHPFHLHGHDAYILQTHASTHGFSVGWNPFDTRQPPPGGAMNRVDPIRRDTFVVPRRGYVVFRVRVDNPGVWMLHCHVLWHQASGMAMGIEVTPGVDD
jgi:FtsP/CotA-like multicopper oxidase with cupredoxin domain